LLSTTQPTSKWQKKNVTEQRRDRHLPTYLLRNCLMHLEDKRFLTCSASTVKLLMLNWRSLLQIFLFNPNFPCHVLPMLISDRQIKHKLQSQLLMEKQCLQVETISVSLIINALINF
jgi:hypothetical protein